MRQTRRSIKRGIYILDGNNGGEVRIKLFGSVPLPGDPGSIELELAAEIETPDALTIEASVKKQLKRGKK